MENKKNDKTPKVLGIGGIFFFCDDPKETREWYKKNLGMDVSEWGAKFKSRDMENPEQINALAWSPFKSGSNYFAPSKKEFMINYRVQNIKGLVEQLKKSGVTVLDEIAASDFGKFVHIMDADGNKVELWEA
ncbi:MAG: VOC family protein [Bacteroidia bacterium]